MRQDQGYRMSGVHGGGQRKGFGAAVLLEEKSKRIYLGWLHGSDCRSG